MLSNQISGLMRQHPMDPDLVMSQATAEDTRKKFKEPSDVVVVDDRLAGLAELHGGILEKIG